MHGLNEAVEGIETFGLYYAIVVDSVVVLGISGTVVYKLLNQKTGWFIWLQIVMLWASYLLYLARNIFRLQYGGDPAVDTTIVGGDP